MKRLLLYCGSLIALSCNNKPSGDHGVKDNRVALHSDTLNTVTLRDTLVIFESTCRGCAYETSTHFDISDSAGLVKLFAVHTIDNNPSGVNGGNISKELVLLPMKTGFTTMKLYKFWKQEETAEDSARYISYKIEVRN
jgi:hypothetical protein